MQAETALPDSLHETRPTVFHRTTTLANRLLVPFALVAVLVATVMVVVLHLLPEWGGVNPITGMLSDYGVLPDGWVFDTALDIMSIGSVALLVKMAWHGVVRRRVPFILMISWCVCLVGIASFTKDPNTATQTFRGALHLYSTAAACFSLPVADTSLFNQLMTMGEVLKMVQPPSSIYFFMVSTSFPPSLMRRTAAPARRAG